MESWIKVLREVTDQENAKQPPGPGPLDEIEYWRARSTVFSSLFEQLNLPHVQLMRRLIASADNYRRGAPEEFKKAYDQLNRDYLEARDNLKFLQTLERHFRNLSPSHNPATVGSHSRPLHTTSSLWCVSADREHCATAD